MLVNIIFMQEPMNGTLRKAHQEIVRPIFIMLRQLVRLPPARVVTMSHTKMERRLRTQEIFEPPERWLR